MDSGCFQESEYIEGVTLTQHLNQMKLFSAIATAAVIGTSFIVANPSEASQWVDTRSGKMVLANDGDRMLYVTDGKTFRGYEFDKLGYPIANGSLNVARITGQPNVIRSIIKLHLKATEKRQGSFDINEVYQSKLSELRK